MMSSCWYPQSVFESLYCSIEPYQNWLFAFVIIGLILYGLNYLWRVF